MTSFYVVATASEIEQIPYGAWSRQPEMQIKAT
jgi:hypothetical protein